MAKKIEPTLLTDGNPARRIIVFALPIFFAEFLGIFYTMADAFIVGRWLGINGLALFSRFGKFVNVPYSTC